MFIIPPTTCDMLMMLFICREFNFFMQMPSVRLYPGNKTPLGLILPAPELGEPTATIYMLIILLL